jgi:hypothetical protein
VKTDSPPRGRLAPGGPRGYLLARREAETESSTGEGHFHKRTRPPIGVSPRILVVLRRGSGAATNVTLGERSLRRGYAGAKMCRVRQEGIHFQNHLKDTSVPKSLEPPRGDQGKECALRNQESLFAPDHSRPTSDSIYLGAKIDAAWKSHRLTPAALQKLVNQYGDRAVEDKLRELYGFPPEEALRSAYAYLETMLREGL